VNVLSVVMLIFSVIGAFDRILGNKFGLGKEFERGFLLLGDLALSMIGMIVVSPVLADIIAPALDLIYGFAGIDPSSVTSLLFANDMGGAALASSVAKSEALGRFGGMVVASMMGCTVSFAIPFALNAVGKEKHKMLLLGMLSGIVTVPAGCLVGGLILKLPFGVLLLNLLPLMLFSFVVALGLYFFPDISAKIFGIFGLFLKILITAGLILGIAESLLEKEIIKGLNSLSDAGMICLNAAVVMTGAFPLLSIVSKLLGKALNKMGNRIGINEKASLGFIACLANSISTFGMMKEMDDKGVLLNAAFAVSAAFVFGDHLAFTMAYDAGALSAMIIGKLSAGLLAIPLGMFVYGRLFPKRKA